MSLPMEGPRFGSLNFMSSFQELGLPVVTDGASAQAHQDCDVLFVVGAPREFIDLPSEAIATLFFDIPEIGLRELPPNAYQVTCIEPLDRQKFLAWANRATKMIQNGITQRGLNGLHVQDLCNMLKACHSKRLVITILEYEDIDQLPMAILSKLHYRNLFAWLFASNAMNLSHFSELHCALEDINQDADVIRLGANYYDEPGVQLLLLGEPVI